MRKVAEEKNNQKQVIVIPAIKALKSDSELCAHVKKKRVCGYARVSTDEEDQLSSYEAQIDYYRNYILKNEEWEYVDVYSDEGITGCNTKKRAGFNKMIEDALNGKIDLIITKSISRFARNTVDSLSTIRKLKEHNVEVFFERENIWTFDSKGELLITILSSLAQEEARSISENSTWGQRKRFADGRYSVAYANFLGYDKDFKVNEKEAEIVKYIYDTFLAGKTYGEIKHELEDKGVPSPSGKKTWYLDVIKKILMNEKYCGDALLQKEYTSDFLTKTRKKNKGEIKQYYITNGHEAIISKEQYEIVQIEIRKRENEKMKKKDIFSGKLICKECGDKYYRCFSYNRDSNKKIIKTYTSYRCDSNGFGCPSKYINIDIVQKKFLEDLNTLDERQLDEIIDYSINDIDYDSLNDQMRIIEEKIRMLSQSENTKYKEISIKMLTDEKEKVRLSIEKYDELKKKIIDLKTKKICEFDVDLFFILINRVYIDGERNVYIVFKGQEDTNHIKNREISRHKRKKNR